MSDNINMPFFVPKREIQLLRNTLADYEIEAAKVNFSRMLANLGYDPEFIPHMEDTPRRYVESLIEYFFDEPWKFTTFDLDPYVPGGVGDPGMIIMRDITFKSLCAHHFAPFFGKAHVAYLPTTKMVGLSKLARTIESHAKGPNVQEDIGSKSADFLMQKLDARGVMVVIEAEHTCYTLRGVKAHGSSAVTSAVRGVFFDDARARAEAMSLFRLA